LFPQRRRGINRLWEQTKNKTNRGGGILTLTDCGNKQKIKQIDVRGHYKLSVYAKKSNGGQ
jgi:hypothetical protein